MFHWDLAFGGELAWKTLWNLSERNHRRVISVVINCRASSKRHVVDPTPIRQISAGSLIQLVMSWYSVFFCSNYNHQSMKWEASPTQGCNNKGKACVHVPMNSKRLTAGQLHRLVVALEVPSSGTSADILLIIEGKLTKLGWALHNVHVIDEGTPMAALDLQDKFSWQCRLNTQ